MIKLAIQRVKIATKKTLRNFNDLELERFSQETSSKFQENLKSLLKKLLKDKIPAKI